MRYTSLHNGFNDALCAIFWQSKFRQSFDNLAVNRALVRPVLCALLGLVKLFALLLGHALPFALNRRFLIPLSLRCRFLRAPLGCLGICYAPRLSLFSLADAPLFRLL